MTPQCWEVAQVIFDLFSQMVISQLLVNKIELNKFHLVANVIAFKLNINLTSDYTSIFFCEWKSQCPVFSDTDCIQYQQRLLKLKTSSQYFLQQFYKEWRGKKSFFIWSDTQWVEPMKIRFRLTLLR